MVQQHQHVESEQAPRSPGISCCGAERGFAAYQSRRRVWVSATFYRAYPPGPASDGERRGSAPWWLVEETADICGGGAAGASMETDMDRDLHTDLSRQGHAIFALRCIIARNSLLYLVLQMLGPTAVATQPDFLRSSGVYSKILSTILSPEELSGLTIAVGWNRTFPEPGRPPCILARYHENQKHR